MLLVAAVLALVLMPASAVLLQEPLFLLLLVAFLYMLVLGFALTFRRRWPFWIVLLTGVVVSGTAGAVYYREPLLGFLDADYRARRLVVEMLAGCTSPAPEPGALGAQRRPTKQTTHLVVSLSPEYNYGAWNVHADKGEIYAADETASLLIDQNGCRGRGQLSGPG